MLTRKGTSYWPTYRAARDYAESHGYPTDRIIAYDLGEFPDAHKYDYSNVYRHIGWAIQTRISGHYVDATAEIITERRA